MNKCLVTKLNGSSNNSELRRLGEMRMKILKVSNPTDVTQGFAIGVNKPVVLKIVDNGYFTDRTLTVNKGKTITLNIGYNDVFVNNDNVEIAILDKYSITELSFYPSQTSAAYIRNKYFNLSDLEYSTALTSLNLTNLQITGDIVNLKNLTSLTYLNLVNSQITGDIVNLKNLTSLTFLNLVNSQVTGDIANLNGLTALTSLNLANSQVNGDIVNLKNLTSLTFLNLNDSQVNGDIVNLKNLTSLTSLNLDNSQVNGDIVNLKNLTALTVLSISNTNVTGDIVNLKNLTRIGKELMLKGLNISGNIGDLPNQVLFVSNKTGRGNFTWTTSSRTNILAMEDIACDNIDKLLQDMSNMNANFAGQQSYYKIIKLIGTRTSASDAAVQTLQSKGYTVSISNA